MPYRHPVSTSMIYNPWKLIQRAVYVWIWTTLSVVLGVPLVGPDVMSFDSLSPVGVFGGPVFPSPTLNAGIPASSGAPPFDGPDPTANANFIGAGCTAGEMVGWDGSCRRNLAPSFPSSPQAFPRANTRGFVIFPWRQQRRRGREQFKSPTPSPELLYDED